MTDALGKCVILLAQNYCRKGSLHNYTYRSDLENFAIMEVARVWNRYDETRSANAFAFLTQVIKNAVRQELNKERRQRDIRDELLVSQGLEPSMTYQMAYNKKQEDKK